MINIVCEVCERCDPLMSDVAADWTTVTLSKGHHMGGEGTLQLNLCPNCAPAIAKAIDTAVRVWKATS
jgi:hypothetical protein